MLNKITDNIVNFYINNIPEQIYHWIKCNLMYRRMLINQFDGLKMMKYNVITYFLKDKVLVLKFKQSYKLHGNFLLTCVI